MLVIVRLVATARLSVRVCANSYCHCSIVPRPSLTFNAYEGLGMRLGSTKECIVTCV